MSTLRKAVILARGLGTRMRRATPGALAGAGAGPSAAQARVADTGVKALIPIDRPFLDYVISTLADEGLTDIGLVVGPEHEALRQQYGDPTRLTRVSITFAIQAQPLGTADAVLAAERFTGDDDFLVLNSDNYYPGPTFAAMRGLSGPGLPGFSRRGLLTGNVTADRLAAFALLEVGPDHELRRVVEKPDLHIIAQLGEQAPVSMNCWRFDARIHEACRLVGPSPRGELELPAAVQIALARGVRFTVVPVDLPVLDLSTRQDIDAVAGVLRGRTVEL